ncbi:uncharacterized protein LOC126830350 isoform X2 [Patella vulgata]|uniref:uncharacterized protein LOC126830350 isoform X2 n=1 Tax=Patella vulgata TaxID=6465 RepID=UPI0024A9B60D|nr:uncharacterized protein LOC126830350 isoform X2 [Patella vulgata]
MPETRNPTVIPSHTMTTLPPIFGKSKIKKDYKKPPKIPVVMNKRTAYKPYTKMYGDDMVELKRMEQAELGVKTRSRNKMEDERCWRNVNLSYRDHLYTMGSIRQEQSLVYQLMCKVQKDKRRIQRQTHRRRENEFQEKMRWQRIKSMCHFVVLKFRENVQRKREQRLKQEGLSASQIEASKRSKVKSSAKQDIYQSKITTPVKNRHDEEPPSRLEMVSEVGGEGEDCHSSFKIKENNGRDSTSNTNPKNVSVSDISFKTKSKTEADMDLKKSGQNVVHSQNFCTISDKIQPVWADEELRNLTKDDDNINVNDVNLKTPTFDEQVQHQHTSNSDIRTRIIQVRKDRPSKPLTRIIHNSQENQTSEPLQKNQTAIRSTSDITSQTQEAGVQSEQTDCSSVVSSVKARAPLNPVKVRRRGTTRPPTTYLTSNLEQSMQSEKAHLEKQASNYKNEEKCQVSNQTHKEEKESLVVLMKKRARHRAKKDLDALNKESFVKYERTKSGLLKSYPGKRETFVPPSSKNLYTRHKLLRQEREAILMQRFKLAKFYESVMEMRATDLNQNEPRLLGPLLLSGSQSFIKWKMLF